MWVVRRIGENRKSAWQTLFSGYEDEARSEYANELAGTDPGEMLILQSPDGAIQANHNPPAVNRQRWRRRNGKR